MEKIVVRRRGLRDAFFKPLLAVVEHFTACHKHESKAQGKVGAAPALLRVDGEGL
jgi:hypothetical protein